MNCLSNPIYFPGNKAKVVSVIGDYLGGFDQFDSILDPFCGTCSVSRLSGIEKAYCFDANPDLIDLHIQIQNMDWEWISLAEKMFRDHNIKDTYDARRDYFNSRTASKKIQTILFWYLNRHGIAGLCRYNQSGVYNVPFGYRKLIKWEGIFKAALSFHSWSQGVQFSCQTWEESLSESIGKKNLLVYLDPPYLKQNKTAFTAYNSSSFGLEDQKRLAEKATWLRSQGHVVAMSNNDLPETTEIFKDATQYHTYESKRNVGGVSNGETKRSECLIVWHPLDLISISNNELEPVNL